jgi:integrase
MREIYQQYIQDKSTAWSPASIRSESLRLNRILHLIENTKEAPSRLWDAMKPYGGYTRVTMWNRVVCFLDWAIENGHATAPNHFKIFRDRNPRAFQNQYIRKPSQLRFKEIVDALNRIPDEELRNKSFQLFYGGMRFSESYTLTPDGYVTGKGNKIRKVYLPEIAGPIAAKSRYRALLRQLKKVGITGPHKLRSARMMSLVDQGANPFQLKKFAGWASLATAESYIEARDEDLQKLAAKDLEGVL